MNDVLTAISNHGWAFIGLSIVAILMTNEICVMIVEVIKALKK